MIRKRFTTPTMTALLGGLLVTFAVAQTMRPSQVLHDLAGRDNCLMCHAAGAMEPVTDVPATHEGWENVACLWCHGADAAMLTTDPPVITHDLAGRDNCLMCHAPGAMDGVVETPADHEGRESSHCQMCHKVAD